VAEQGTRIDFTSSSHWIFKNIFLLWKMFPWKTRLHNVWFVQSVGFYFPFPFFGQLRKLLVYSAFIFVGMFFIEMFFSSVFFHGGVPAGFSGQVHDPVGRANAHPTALKVEVEDK